MPKAKILIVEDETIVALDIRKSVESMGYLVCAMASSGEDAIQKAGETRPELALMDIVLKGEMDGIQAAEQINALFKIPIVYLTAYDDEDVLQRAKITTPYGYITKPFNDRELRIAIEIALYKNQAEAKIRKTELWLAAVLRSVGDGVITSDKEGRVTFMNQMAEKLTGWKKEDALGKKLTEILHIKDKELGSLERHLVEKIITEGLIINLLEDRLLIAKDGTQIPISDSVAPIRDDDGETPGTVLVFRDISAHKKMEKLLELSRDILHTLNQPLKKTTQVSNILKKIKNQTGIEAVGIRLRDGEDFPYYSIIDFSSHFVELENSLCSRDSVGEIIHNAQGNPFLECMCGNVIMKRTDPSLSFFTEYGSFWTNSTSKLLASTTEKERHVITRNRCNSEGYESVALIPLHSGEETIGLLQLNDRKPDRFTLEMIQFFEGLGSSIGIAVDRQESFERLRKALGATVQAMASAVETRDPYTAGHQVRSANLSRAIATEMGFPPEKIEGIRMAGSIHDIGKLSIPAEILSKPTKLSNIEFSLIKEHAKKGYEMLKDVESPWPLAEIVHQHHERMDGSGYPRNLEGDDILIEARILAVADVVEAMASHRPYRPGLGIDAALNEIEKNRGICYDNTVVDACLKVFRVKGFKLAEA